MKNNYGIMESLAYGDDLTANKSVPKCGNQFVCARTNLKISVLVSVWSKSRYFLMISESSNIWQIALIVVFCNAYLREGLDFCQILLRQVLL
jgi:hypothetical protein